MTTATLEQATGVTATTQANKPVHAIKDGMMEVAIYRNEGETGAWYQAIPNNQYQKDGAYHDTASYKRREAVIMGKMMMDAGAWIRGQEQLDRAAARN